MSTPFPSGRIRSMIAASGGRTASESSASWAVSAVATSKPASRRMIRSARRIWRSSSHHEHTLLVAHCVSRGGVHGQLDHEARALARERLRSDPAPVRLQEAAGDRQPEARSRAVLAGCAVEGLEHPLEVLPWRSRPMVGDPDQHLPVRRARTHRHRLLPGEAGGVLQHVGEGALQLLGVGVHRGSSGSNSRVEARGGRGHGSDRGADHLVHADPVLRAAPPPRPGAG